MKKNNILILSAGRRVELVQDFQTEAARFSDGIGVFATDLNPHMSSACHVADRAFSVPRIDVAEYIDSIFELAKQHDIGLIVPTIDTELLKLAEVRDRFEAEGIHIVISDAKLITLCRDKRLTSGLFAQYSIRSPEIYERDHLVFPCFAKPYDGSRAIGAKKINTPADLTVDITEDPKMMFTQYIDIENTFSEFTVDMYYDRQGRLKCAIPRERGRRTRLHYRAILRQQNRQHDLRRGNQPSFRRRFPADLRRRRQLSGLADSRIHRRPRHPFLRRLGKQFNHASL